MGELGVLLTDFKELQLEDLDYVAVVLDGLRHALIKIDLN